MRINLFFPIFGSLALLWSGYAEAKPHGFHLKRGDASQPLLNEMGIWVVKSGKKTMIDWTSFNIDKNEMVHFQQADQLSYVLNCVVGESASSLHGSLTSNGSVFLINPNGILIGPDARIETAGFIASTLDLFNEDLSGQRFYGESDKQIVHEGVIRCDVGDVYLIGKVVENRGVIQTPQGQQGVISGCDVWIQPKAAPHVLIRSDMPIDPDLAKENPYAYAIRHSGQSEGKAIYVVAEKGIAEVSGTLDATSSGEIGGTIHVLGEVIHIDKTASIDVSGKLGGGTLLIGGDYQGKNPDIRNADQVWLDDGAILKADALENGNGGKIILWGNQANLSSGSIFARGGSQGGDGGFVEISSPGYLVPNATVSTLAPLGKIGLLYYDPCAVTISTSADSGNTFSAGAYTFSGATATINNTTLSTNLDNGNVTIDSTASGTGTASISSTAAVSWSGGGALTLVGGSISISSAITGGGAITITGDQSAASTGNGVTISAAVSNTSGNISITGLAANATPTGACVGIDLITGGVVSTSGTGTITLNGTGGASSTSQSNGIYLNGGTITSTSGLISLTGIASGTGVNHGILMATTNGITSTSGGITLSGTTTASGSGDQGSSGVVIPVNWTTGTTGDLTFTDCQGGLGTDAQAGVYIFSNGSAITVSTQGNIIATNQILSGTGEAGLGGGGFLIDTADLTSTGGGNIDITATFNGEVGSLAAVGVGGINLYDGTLSTTGNGSINLLGTCSPDNSNFGPDEILSVGGVKMRGSTLSTQNGNINIAGTTNNVSYSNGVSGVILNGPTLSSTGGSINISGVSSGSSMGSNNYGVFMYGPRINAPTVNFGSTVLGVSGCMGGGGTGSHGLEFSVSTPSSGNFNLMNCVGGADGGNGIDMSGAGEATTSAVFAGNLTATTGIVGGGPSGMGFYQPGTFLTTPAISLTGAGNTIAITASGSPTGTTGPCHGISLGGSGGDTAVIETSSATGGSITLVGIAGTSQAATPSHGINISGTAQVTTAANNSPISLTGTGGTGAGCGNGIDLSSSANSITSGTSGAITLSGTGSTNSTVSSYGVSVDTNIWTPGNGGLLSFTNCVGGAGSTSHGVTFATGFSGSGPVTFTNCSAGTGGGNGINVAAAFTTTGNITATSQIQGVGPGGVGFASIANFAASGSGNTIAITATGGSGTGGCHGISVTSGTLATSNATGGAVTLIGTGGSSSDASHGVNISGTGLVSTSANNSLISITGMGGAGSGGGNGINLVGSSNSITSGASGNITLTGIGSTNSSSTSYGVEIGTNPWAPGNGGVLTFTGCAGGAGMTGNGVNFDTAFTGSGNVAFTNCVRGSSTGYGVSINENFTTTGAVNFTSSTPSTSSFTSGVSLTSITAASFILGSGIPTVLQNSSTLTLNTSGSNGAVTFGGTMDGVSADASSLTLTAGAGTVNFNGDIGDTTPIGTLSVTGGIVNFAGNVTNLATTVTNSGQLTTLGFFNSLSSFAQIGTGSVSLGGNITTFESDISFNSAVTLSTSVELNTGGTAGNITFSSAIDGAASGADGLALIGLSINFDAPVGSMTPLSSLEVTAPTINLGGNQSVATGPMTYNGNVILNSNIRLSDSGSQGITFSASSGDAIVCAAGHAYNLTLLASNSSIAITSGDTNLMGPTAADGGTLTATASKGITFGGQILTQGGANSAGNGGDGGNIILTCSAGSIAFHNMNASGGNAVSGTGGSSGDIMIMPASGYVSGLPIGIITINSDLSGNGNLVALAGSPGGIGGSVVLSANRSTSAEVATIASSLSGNSIEINAETCTFGPFEAMTAFGNLTMNANTLTLGDLVALDAITLVATTINLLTHGDITLLNNLAATYTSPSLHFLGGTGYSATGTFNPSGPINAKDLNLSPVTFKPLLTLNSTILNYDNNGTPTPPTPPNPTPSISGANKFSAAHQTLIYELLIADAQLSDLCPIYPTLLPPPYELSIKKK